MRPPGRYTHPPSEWYTLSSPVHISHGGWAPVPSTSPYFIPISSFYPFLFTFLNYLLPFSDKDLTQASTRSD